MPAKPKLATVAASETEAVFPTWDELVAEANIDKPDYQLPLPDGSTITIPCPSGDAYIELVQAQRTGNAVAVLEALVPDNVEMIKIRRAMKGTKEKPVHFPIIDTIAGKVLRYYFGLSIQSEEQGN
jgi:hypothetical protein